ncbi:beta-glucosidase-like isoform X2 [Olea europaea subsp. europaea]|uniref:Beta-glucosidase-like isoform X2 n=1 Tax=Olea europaea subsp. europaea TaxID=158383 RepID=A0A8S0PWD0_OLEEU|nr:beta-glucosidase-like isoform X2 [Olea europaea subsp. europaea]
MASSQTELKRSSFHEKFIFGGATSAYQEDVALMKEVGLNSYRFSISWSRILPDGKLCAGISKQGIQFYNDLIDALLEGGIEPCATLFHWDVPQKLEDEYGGFKDHQIVEHFCEFAEICFWEFGDRVKYWITHNEPWSFTICGYVRKRFPPLRGYPLDAKSTSQESVEQTVRDSANDHRSKIIVPQLPYSEGDGIKEAVQRAYNSENDDSPEGKAARELVAEAYNCDNVTNSKDGAPSSPSSEGDSVSQEDNSPSPTSSKRDSVRISSADPKMRQFTSSKVDPVKVSSQQQYAFYINSDGDPGKEPYIVAHNLILAHAHAVNIYRKYYQEHQQGKIGMTNVTLWYYAFDENNQEDKEAALRALDFLLGWFVDPVMTGDYPPSMRKNVGERLPEFKPDEKALVKDSCDFLGINYYTARYARNISPQDSRPQDSEVHYDNDLRFKAENSRNGKPIGDRGGSDWLYIVPDGIYQIMVHIKEKYNNPEIIITENGLSLSRNDELTISEDLNDEIRVNYFKGHIENIGKAIEDGVNLTGYFIWSFFDNFEWDSGYNVRFGVYHVDFRDDLERRPKKSVMWWKDFLNKS